MDEPGHATVGQDQLLDKLRSVTLGEYDVAGELGRGGMSTVYLAHEISLDRKVAIKVMSPGLVFGQGMVERFKREARTAANLSHPNIIPVYAVKEVDGLLFFVMKLVEGTQLDSIVRELGQVPIPMVEAILAQVGGAFGYAHRRGVIHRDIKPSNILIDEEGWAVVTDFGIAKVTESEGLTVSGATVGTPTYMSPEQCTGAEITGASDQYSLGVVAYEMLTGKPPFSGGTMMALMYSHFHDPPTPIETLRPDCPPGLARAVMRMLAKDPAARFPSMEEAVAAMGAKQLSHDDPTRSQLILLARTGSSHKVVSQVQTPRSPVPLASRTGGGSAQVRAAPAPATSRRWIPIAVGAVALAVAVGSYFASSRRSAAGGPPPVIPAAGQELPPNPPPPVATNATAERPEQPERRERHEPIERPEPDTRKAATGQGNRGLAATGVGLPAASQSGTQAAASSATQAAVTPPPAPAPGPAPAPAPAPSPAPSPPPPPSALSSPTSPDDAVRQVIVSYGNALEAGNLAEARRIFPGMPRGMRQSLESYVEAGGSMSVQWQVSEVAVAGDAATARVTGTSLVSTPSARGTPQPVNVRVRLERRAGAWLITGWGN